MELRQLRYFICIVKFGSMGRAALELGVVTSALSQQIGRLESELSTRLLHRTATGVTPTDAGVAFWRQAQLALRHVDHAVHAAQHSRLSGHVSVGMAPSTTGVLGLPFLRAMRERYPDIRLRLVESLSGHLSTMLDARQIDLAILFQGDFAKRFSATPLLNERLFAIAARDFTGLPKTTSVKVGQLARIPLVLPSNTHGLRVLIDAAFSRAKSAPSLAAEIDGLAMLMSAVADGFGATIQPGAALARFDAGSFKSISIKDSYMVRTNQLVSLSEDELSPAGLAARVVLLDVAHTMVIEGRWAGATLHEL